MYGTVGQGPPLEARREDSSRAPCDKAHPLLVFAGLFLLLVFLAGYFSNEIINAKMHDIIRHKWALEAQHATTEGAWAIAIREHQELQRKLHQEIIMLESQG